MHRRPEVDGYLGGKGTTVIDRRYRLQEYDGYQGKGPAQRPARATEGRVRRLP